MSDGWGDASGIEGNYDDDDSSDTDVEEEPAEASSSTAPNESSSTSESTATNETNETNETSKTKTNIKDEWNGRTIYIPDGILGDLEDTYLESQLKLRKAGQDEFKKNRHFYPLLVQFGLEGLADADADELQNRLSDL
ncbi:hypothetical protein ACFQL3_00535 [Natronoarchaeum sp. GCM10025321]|uniref:hypothetical protein n=1 Tax=Natronoarchaeum sp. GCM10025321 TaxID=3252684 RepID=UPI003611D340